MSIPFETARLGTKACTFPPPPAIRETFRSRSARSVVSAMLAVAMGTSSCVHYANPEKPGAADLAANRAAVESVPGLVAFWTFGEEPGQARRSAGTADKHPLMEVGKPVAREEGGPYSGYHAHFDGQQFMGIEHNALGGLDISGREAQVSMFAVAEVDDMSRGVSIAGIWSEGKGENDDTGTRQYALLLNMPMYGGPRNVTPHVSSEGGVSRRASGTGMPWCVDDAASVSVVPEHRWVTLGFTYDGRYIRAYFNGVMEARQVDPVKDNRTDPYFAKEGPFGGHRGINPYFHGRGIFKYDPARDGGAKMKPSPFLVGARYAVGSMFGEAMKGSLAGLAVFNRALTEKEMQKLHASAHLQALQ